MLCIPDVLMVMAFTVHVSVSVTSVSSVMAVPFVAEGIEPLVV